DYLLLEEVCAISRSAPGTARHWIRTGRLPSIRPGRRRLVRRSDLERFLAEANPSAQRSAP
ncbi:MAG: Helix-turn-helix domain, partial [Pseudomonadota bacterium]